MKLKIFAATTLVTCATLCMQARKVHTIGDSTMATYAESTTVTRGWGQMFQQFFKGDITVNNRAKNGASSKSFYKEASFWQSVKKQIEPGDYVLIQFAHNDEKDNGCDGDELKAYYTSIGDDAKASSTDYRGTTASGTYKEYLRKYIEETRALGATPVLVGAICRKYFSGSTIRRNGRHDLGDNVNLLKDGKLTTGYKVAESDHTFDYPYQMQEVAKEMNVQYLDLTTATKELYESYGDTKANELLFDGNGSTHTSAMGATLIARLAAQLMQKAGILTENINLTSDLSVNPAMVDFGQAYKGQSVTKEISVNGFDLVPADGTVTVTASNGCKVSADGTNYSQTTTLNYKGGNLIGNFKARYDFNTPGNISESIVVSTGDKSITIPLTGKCIELASGVTTSAYWRLGDDDNCAAEGPVNAIGEKYSGMKLQRYANPNANTTWPENTGFDASRKTQRNIIEGEEWPAGEIDEVSTRWIEFAVKPAKNTTFHVNEISMYVCGCGGNGMRCKIYYSKDRDFANAVNIADFSGGMKANDMMEVKATPVLELNEDDTLRVRIYPWYNSAATGKTICVSDVKIGGVSNESGSGAIDKKNATIAWAFDQSGYNPTAATVSEPEAISTTSFSLGSKLYFNGKQGSLSKLNPTEKIGNSRDDASFVSFSIVPKKGMTFIPTNIAFNSQKCGTSGGTLDVTAQCDGKTVELVKGFNPERNSASESSLDINGLATEGKKIDFVFYVYNLANNKQFALGNIVVTGNLNGTPVSVPAYTFCLKSTDEKAGTITSNPSGDKFDEGTSLTVSTTENFGYHFLAWVDDNNNVVSTENPYTFELKDNTSLTATYKKNNVYALNLKLEGGANNNLVQFAPTGNIVNGIHYYEEGTDVKLTALNNRILTFTNWEDNTTAMEREIKMDSEKNLSAQFVAADYIVGWDLYDENPAQERAADYKAESENAGLLSLRNADNNTSSWLACGAQKGAQNGKYAARCWKKLADKYYFEISFSTIGYNNIVLSAAVGDDYNAHSIVNAQYSIDGTNYTTFGTYNLPNRGWDAKEFALPQDAAGQKLVYVRFMQDYDSPLAGVTSDYDGIAVAEIFVLADKETIDDKEAPKLLSSIPADNATGASATGSVILTFNEKIVASENSYATINGETLTPTISGKTAVYQYSGLKYSTKYTFNLPAGMILDRSGNAFEGTAITFTTMDRKQPEPHVYDAVVAQDGTGDYTTIQAAIDNAPTNRVKPWLIFVKEGTYKEHVDLPESKPYLHFIGQGRDKVFISDDKLCGGDNALSVDKGATFVARANNLYFEGLSFVNSYGKEKNAGPQALALNTGGDRIVFNNVGMYSYQDTWITTNKANYRHYVKNSFIEGAVDFIYNSGNVFFDHDTLNIVRKDGGFIVAPSHTKDTKWGYVFVNNVITAPGNPTETSVWLGRPWHNFPKTVFINTKAEVTIPATGWYETMGGLPDIWADYNTVDINGNPVDLSHRRDSYYYMKDGEKIEGKAKNFLTDDEAAQYTIKNVLGGDDNWQPEILTEACEAPKPAISGNSVSWNAVPYAICYVITKNGKVEGFTTSNSCEYMDGAEYEIQAVNEYGGLSTAAKATSQPTDINAVKGSLPNNATIYSVNGTQLKSAVKGINIITNGMTTQKIIK